MRFQSVLCLLACFASVGCGDDSTNPSGSGGTGASSAGGSGGGGGSAGTGGAGGTGGSGGTAGSAGSPNGGPLAIDPTDPHRFILGSQPVGYYPSIAALTADQTDYTGYYVTLIDALESQHVNLFRQVFTMGQPYADSITPYLRPGPGNANDGKPKFDLDQFDQTYFDYWHEVVAYAETKGVVVEVTLLDTWHNKDLVTDASGPDEWGMDLYIEAK